MINKEQAAAAPEGYGLGTILAGPSEMGLKAIQGRRLVQQRVLSLGKDSIYNLTGLVRAFQLDPEDLPGLESQFSFYGYFFGRAEEMAIRHMGGDPAYHRALLCNRVSAASLAVMLALLRRGNRVISVVGAGRSHPSVQQAVELVGATFHEAIGIDGLDQAIGQGPWDLLVITPLTPQKYHMVAGDVRRAIALANQVNIPVFIDDAHMSARAVFYNEPLTFELGDVDVAVWSLDKHFPGPRMGAVVAHKNLMDRIQSQAWLFGLEAQSGHYVAAIRGMESYDPNVVRQAGELSRRLLERFQSKFGKCVYQAGPGVAMSADDVASMVFKRAQTRNTVLVPAEISTAACFIMLQQYGIATIPVTGYPGTAPTFRLMMHPDGHRLGLDRIDEAVESALDTVGTLLQREDEVRALLLGPQ